MNGQELQQEIRRGIIGNVYLFIAADDYMGNAYLSVLGDAVAFGELRSMNETVYDEKGVSASEAIAKLMTFPVMNERRIVIVRQSALSGNESLAKALAQYIQSPNPTSVLAVYVNEIDKRTKLYKSVHSSGKIVQIPRADRNSLMKWIEDKLQKRNITINKDALDYLIEAGDYLGRESEIDMGYYASEIEKLSAYDLKAKKLTLEAVKKVVSPNINEDIFALSDSVVRGDLSGANRNLFRLSYNKIVPQRVISELARTMRNICVCQFAYEEGKREADIARENGIHPFSVKKALEVKKYYNIKDAKKALTAILNADMMIKFGNIEAQAAIEILAADITSKTFLLAAEKV